MPALDDLLTLLLLPRRPEEVSPWIQAAARNLQGYRPLPSVVRRHRTAEGVRTEARRWTPDAYLPLAFPGAGHDVLALTPEGQLTLCRLEGTRRLRSRPGDCIEDEIYELHPLESPTRAQLDRVRERALEGLHPLGYRHWDQLQPEHRSALVRFGGTWQDAAAALACLEGAERVDTLQLFLGLDAEAGLRGEVEEAGLRGDLRPGVDVLAWLLAQPEWNLNSGLVAMARSAVEDDPERAWSLHRHPNPQVRLRLADLHQGSADRIAWLAAETDEGVRIRLLRALERTSSPSALVERLFQEQDPILREALGWALVHWPGSGHSSRDWSAMNRALFTGIGAENRARLRDKLARQGRLGLKARILG